MLGRLTRKDIVCPRCRKKGKRHINTRTRNLNFGMSGTYKPEHSHECKRCGHKWKDRNLYWVTKTRLL